MSKQARRPWKCRAMENEENPNNGFSVVSHSPWKSLDDFHIPTAATAATHRPKTAERRRPVSAKLFPFSGSSLD